jgi:hypothetical protein
MTEELPNQGAASEHWAGQRETLTHIQNNQKRLLTFPKTYIAFRIDRYPQDERLSEGCSCGSLWVMNYDGCYLAASTDGPFWSLLLERLNDEDLLTEEPGKRGRLDETYQEDHRSAQWITTHRQTTLFNLV